MKGMVILMSTILFIVALNSICAKRFTEEEKAEETDDIRLREIEVFRDGVTKSFIRGTITEAQTIHFFQESSRCQIDKKRAGWLVVEYLGRHAEGLKCKELQHLIVVESEK